MTVAPTERFLLASAFTLAASNSVVFALLGNLQDEFGFGDIGLGFIAASGFVVSFLVQVFVAPLADRGHTKSLLLAGPILAIVGNLLFASGSSLAQFIVARALAGAAAGVFFPPARAVVASLSTERVSERIGALSGIELAGFVTGPVIGGLLVGPLGLRWPFVIFSLLAFVAGVLVISRPVPALASSTDAARLPFGLLRHRPVLVGTLFAVALALPVGLYDSLWDRYLTDLGASDAVVGLSLAAYAAPFVLLSRRGGRLADRVGHVRVAFLGLLVVAPLTAAYGWFDDPLAPIAIGVVEASAQAAAAPAALGLIARGAPAGRAAAAQGLVGACNQLVAAGVAIVATWGYGATTPATLFTVVGAALLILGSIARWLAPRGAPVGRLSG